MYVELDLRAWLRREPDKSLGMQYVPPSVHAQDAA